jgi:hypothetical protein
MLLLGLKLRLKMRPVLCLKAVLSMHKVRAVL